MGRLIVATHFIYQSFDCVLLGFASLHFNVLELVDCRSNRQNHSDRLSRFRRLSVRLNVLLIL